MARMTEQPQPPGYQKVNGKPLAKPSPAPDHRPPKSKHQAELGAHAHVGGPVPGNHPAFPGQKGNIVDEGDKASQPSPTPKNSSTSKFVGALRREDAKAAEKS